MADGKSGIAGSSSESPAMEEAMVVLRPLHGTDAPDPAVTRRIAETVLNDVQQQTGVKPDASNVFEQLHSFSVRAPRTISFTVSSLTAPTWWMVSGDTFKTVSLTA